MTADVLEGYWAANTATEDGGNPGVIRLNAFSNLITRIVLDRTRVQAGRKHASPVRSSNGRDFIRRGALSTLPEAASGSRGS